jgi:non-specific serine/threonine protein kinase
LSLYSLAELAWLDDDPLRATELLRKGLVLNGEVRQRRGTAACLDLLGEIASAASDIRRAARFFGAAESIREGSGASQAIFLRPGWGRVDRARREARLAAARATSSPAAFDADWAEGRAMSIDDAFAFALATDDAAACG